MKSNEVRVGNFILFSGIKTKVIPQDFATQCRGINSSEMPNFEPILLTKEWLLKAGFERLFPTGSTYSLRDFNVSDFGENGIYHYDVKQPIKYVHQLQNLYFAMTGEELVFFN